MDIAEAQEIIDKIIPTFEANFCEVVELDEAQADYSREPRHGTKYVSYVTGLPKAEGQEAPHGAIFTDLDKAVNAFIERMGSLSSEHSKKTLFWRQRPLLEVDNPKKKKPRYQVWSRLAIV